MSEPKVMILLASYNGERYLKQQLESLLAQSYRNWELIIRDDGSSDGTKEILFNYSKSFENIVIIDTPSNYHSACANFSSLFDWVKENRKIDYLMFCDQDDIWLPTKIESSLTQISYLENKGAKMPCIVYGDLHVIDETGVTKNEVINVFKSRPRNILVQNPMFGCTMMLNSELIKIIKNIPPTAENHDYWVALIAVFFGSHENSHEKRILYRQHSNNVTSQGSSFKDRYLRYTGYGQINEFKAKFRMLQDFYHQYIENFDNGQKQMFNTVFCSFHRKTPFKLIKTILKFKIFRKTALQNIGLIVVLFLNYSTIREDFRTTTKMF